MSAATNLTTIVRFTRRGGVTCPLCGGDDSLRRHRGERCSGYQRGDYVYCQQVESPDPSGHLFRHYVGGDRGPCHCGVTHEAGAAPLAANVASGGDRKPAKPPQWHSMIPAHLFFDGTPLDLQAQYRWEWLDHSLRHIEARYRRQDNGEKEPRPWRPAHDDGWEMCEPDAPRVLYRWPELRAAPRDALVLIAESANKVEALRDLGYVATCSPWGAGKWHLVPGAHEEFIGRRVALLADNDAPGRRHDWAILVDLAGVAASLQMVELDGLPPHGDIIDWLAIPGNDGAKLDALIAATPALCSAPAIAEEFPPESPAPEQFRQPEVAELREDLRNMSAYADGLYAHLEETRHILALPPTVAKAEDKVGLLWLKTRGLAPETGTIITREEMARGCGFSVDTAGEVAGTWQELQVIAKIPKTTAEVKIEPGPDGAMRPVRTWRTLNYLAPAAHWAISETHYPTPARPRTTQGGLRVPKKAPETCLNCGSTNLLDTTHRHCNGCGFDHALRHDYPNGPQVVDATPTKHRQVAATPEKLGEWLLASHTEEIHSEASSHSPLNSGFAAMRR